MYRVRNHIALWSHRIFYLARRTRRPGIYIRWARGMLVIYQGLTYSRGAMGKVFDRIFETPVRTEARKKVSEVTSAEDRKSQSLNSSPKCANRMPSSA